MKIEVYAVLKEYFDKQFVVKEQIDSVDALKTYLSAQNPAAKEILKACRFAIDDEFVSHTHPLNDNDNISIIPPSSGG